MQVRAAAHKDPGRLLLLHKRCAAGTARPRGPLHPHGPVDGRGDQVRPADDQKSGGHARGHTHRGSAGRGAGTAAVAVRRVQQGRRARQ